MRASYGTSLIEALVVTSMIALLALATSERLASTMRSLHTMRKALEELSPQEPPARHCSESELIGTGEVLALCTAPGTEEETVSFMKTRESL